MGTQTGALLCCFAILSWRFEIATVHVILKAGLIDKGQHGRVFITIFIITSNNHFFNYAFKNIAVKSVQHFVLLQRFAELRNTSFHSAFCFCGLLQILALLLKLVDLAA